MFLKLSITKRAKIALSCILLIFISLHVLTNHFIFSKHGRALYLPNILSISDFLIGPIGSKGNISIPKFRLEESGIYDTGKITSSEFSSECKIILFPKIDQPYFELKLSKSNYYKRKQSVKLYPFQKANLAPLFGNLINEKLDLVHCQYELILLEHRGVEHPYFIRETYNSQLIEKQNISNGIHFKIEQLSNEYTDGVEVTMVNTNAEIKEAFIDKKIEQLNKAINDNDPSDLSDIFDFEYMSDYFIFSHLTGRSNLTNTRWIYRLTNGKIYPLATAHNSFRKNKKIKSIWKLMLKSSDFKNTLSELLYNDTIFPQTHELNEIQENYAPYLSNLSNNLSMSHRELNYRLHEDYDLLIENIKSLAEFRETLIVHEEVLEKENTQLTAIEKMISNHGFKLNSNTVIITKGTYQIDSNLILPTGVNLRIEAGTTIQLNDSVSFIVNGSIHINGNSSEKVIISSVNDIPFGVFGSIGNGKDTSYIAYLDISNGSEAYIDGKYLSGALCLYHQNVVIKHINCFENNADDGLNIKYGNILIENSTFRDNWKDQLDLDFCYGVVKNCDFKSNSSDSNGDGLDLSGSNVTIENCNYDNFNDKGVSIGENSRVKVINCKFYGNLNAVAIKDLAIVEVRNNIFTNNVKVFNLYMKKPIFGGGKLILGENVFINNKELSVKDTLSQIEYLN